jgi:hypothetical protein
MSSFVAEYVVAVMRDFCDRAKRRAANPLD